MELTTRSSLRKVLQIGVSTNAGLDVRSIYEKTLHILFYVLVEGHRLASLIASLKRFEQGTLLL